MPIFRMELNGIRDVKFLIDAFADSLEMTNEEMTKDISHELQAFLRDKPYPPELPFQRYERTYELRRQWVVRRWGRSAHYIRNRQTYASYVVGDSDGLDQAEVHQHRWWIAVDEIDAHLTRLWPVYDQRWLDKWEANANRRA